MSFPMGSPCGEAGSGRKGGPGQWHSTRGCRWLWKAHLGGETSTGSVWWSELQAEHGVTGKSKERGPRSPQLSDIPKLLPTRGPSSQYRCNPK